MSSKGQIDESLEQEARDPEQSDERRRGAAMLALLLPMATAVGVAVLFISTVVIPQLNALDEPLARNESIRSGASVVAQRLGETVEGSASRVTTSVRPKAIQSVAEAEPIPGPKRYVPPRVAAVKASAPRPSGRSVSAPQPPATDSPADSPAAPDVGASTEGSEGMHFSVGGPMGWFGSER